MAEAVKKVKAPAKPRNTAARTKKSLEQAKAAAPSNEEIAQLARQYWAERGWHDGYAEHDWLRAEQELRNRAQ